MAEILNLRQARKAKARSDAAKAAENNRIAFGRTAAEKRETAAREDRAARYLDNHRRESSSDDA